MSLVQLITMWRLSISATVSFARSAESISAATVNAAHAIRNEAHCGSLQFGKDADLLMLNVADYREISYYSGVNLVALTMRRGKIVYRESEVAWQTE